MAQHLNGDPKVVSKQSSAIQIAVGIIPSWSFLLGCQYELRTTAENQEENELPTVSKTMLYTQLPNKSINPMRVKSIVLKVAKGEEIKHVKRVLINRSIYCSDIEEI